MLKEQTISWSSWIGYAHGVHSGIHDIRGAEIPDDDEALRVNMRETLDCMKFTEQGERGL